MGRYYYPNENDALSAKIQFLREHHYKINHCFRNTWGTGFVLFDTKEDVNEWYKEHTGHPFYADVYEKGTKFTETDAITEIENSYGSLIDRALSSREMTLPVLAIGLPSTSAFGNRILLKFTKSTDENDIESRFYIHYNAICWDVSSLSNTYIRKALIKLLYNHFYEHRFKQRIEGSKIYHNID